MQNKLLCNARPKVDAMIMRLGKVREKGPGRWLACCPAHHDRSPSLAIRETSDGTILLHCFSGYSAMDVLAAIGLELKNLFPQRARDDHRDSKRFVERWVPGDILAAVAREVIMVLLSAETTRRGDALSRADSVRLAKAASLLRSATWEVDAHVSRC